MIENKYGLIGYPLGHSYSPRIHRHIFQMTKRQGDYLLFEITAEEIPEFLKGLKEIGLEGFNVTIPYKQTILPYMDEVTPEALKIGAVNTVRRVGDRLIGFNTDYIGFMETLSENRGDISDQDVLVLGDGGSARTVYACMRDSHVSNCYMASRKPDKMGNVFPDACLISYEEVYRLKNLKLVVNCTPVGMHPNPDASPLDINRLPDIDLYIDLIYNPAKTLLMDAVEKRGGRAVNGLYMLVSQGVAAQEIWTGKTISKEVTHQVYNLMKEGMNR